MATSTKPIQPVRQEMYDRTGDTYEFSRYGAPHMREYHDYRSELVRRVVEETLGAGQPGKILEVGCGTGMTIDSLSRLPVKHELTGVDFSETMLEQARIKAATSPNPATFIRSSVFDLQFPNDTFDVVYATRFIHQFTQPQKVEIFKKLLQITRPGGKVVIEFYARSYHWLRYWLQAEWRKRSRESYFLHFPTRQDVDEIVGGKYQVLPLRLAGARLLHALMGPPKVRGLTASASSFPLTPLIDEYFVVAQK